MYTRMSYSQFVELVLKCVISFLLRAQIKSFYCDDPIEFLFSFVVAVLFLLWPKRFSKGLFLVLEPIEMVIDLLDTHAHQIGNTIKSEQRSFILCW